MVIDLIDTQLAELKQRYPAARIDRTPDGQQLLVVPGIAPGPGWNMSQVTVRILLPTGFPHVKPDCFYTDAGLLLTTGAEPGSSAVQGVFGDQLRWFSWHLQAWDATTGSLQKYVAFC